MSVTRLVPAILLAACATPLAAQFPPAEVKNLKVLPADMSVRDVIGVMRGFAIGLGVRCEHCHVGQPGQDLSTFDFVSDEKPAKEKARVMLRMVTAINQEHLAGLPRSGQNETSTHVVVTCETCHRGQAMPHTLEQRLSIVLEAQGRDSAVAAYRALRAQYYGRATFDFGEQRVAGLGSQLVGAGKPDDALALLAVNLEYHPGSSSTVTTMGDAWAAKGNKDEAIKHYRWALELDPRNGQARQRLERLSP